VALNYKTGYKADKASATNLILIKNAAGTYRKVNVVQFFSKDGSQQSLPENTFDAIYGLKDVPVDGKFTCMNLSNVVQYEMGYENGSLRSMGTKKPHGANNPAAGLHSTEYYLVTTHYWDDGSTFTDEDYLYTSCYDDTRYDHFENPDGGGGTLTTIEKKYVVSKEHFTSGSTITGLAFQNNMGPTLAWAETSKGVSLPNPMVAKATILGILSHPGTPTSDETIYKWTTYGFTTIFP